MSGPDLSCLHDDCYTQDQMDEVVAERDALLHVAEMIRDADDDCEKDGLPRIPAAARKAIDDAIRKAKA